MPQTAKRRPHQAEEDPDDVGDLLQKWIYMATFVFSAVSLVLFSAPAVQHRVERPLRNRARFKRAATRTVLAGAAALSFALVLATLLVASEVLGASYLSDVLAALAEGVAWLALCLTAVSTYVRRRRTLESVKIRSSQFPLAHCSGTDAVE